MLSFVIRVHDLCMYPIVELRSSIRQFLTVSVKKSGLCVGKSSWNLGRPSKKRLLQALERRHSQKGHMRLLQMRAALSCASAGLLGSAVMSMPNVSAQLPMSRAMSRVSESIARFLQMDELYRRCLVNLPSTSECVQAWSARPLGAVTPCMSSEVCFLL